MNKVNWIPFDAKDSEGYLPKDEDDYGSFIHSQRVLIAVKGRLSWETWVGYLQTWTEGEDSEQWPRRMWKLSGRDGYTLEGVTHWAELPEPPE